MLRVDGTTGFLINAKSRRTALLRIYPRFIELVKLLPYKRRIVVKPRDLCIYMGICDHYSLTCMGWLLSFLDGYGLARRHNRSRPVRYSLSPLFNEIRRVCMLDRMGEDYCVEKGCSLLGLCPYWVIKQGGLWWR